MPKSNLVMSKGEYDDVRFKHKDVKCRCGNHHDKTRKKTKHWREAKMQSTQEAKQRK